MRYACALVLLLAAPAWPQVTKTVSVKLPATLPPLKPLRIALGTFTNLEKFSDGKLFSIGNINDPVDLLGPTRGIYLDGYGAVFTVEISPILTPTVNPFRQKISEEEAARVHLRKLDRMPLLIQAAREVVNSAARTLIQMPDNQQIVFVMRLEYLPWENLDGLPGQVILQADRKSVMSGDIKMEQR